VGIALLNKSDFAGEETAEGFRIYGHVRTGQIANYIE
jgi:hypothetical protein